MDRPASRSVASCGRSHCGIPGAPRTARPGAILRLPRGRGCGRALYGAEGAFADVDAAVTCHPFSSLWTGQWLSLAYTQVYFHFTGVAAHAGMSPKWDEVLWTQ
jgi:hypothetical protein